MLSVGSLSPSPPPPRTPPTICDPCQVVLRDAVSVRPKINENDPGRQ